MKYRSLGITVLLLIISITHYLRMASGGVDRDVEYLNLAVMVALSVLSIYQAVRLFKEKNKQL